MSTSKKYHGITPPIVTPLLARDTLDVAGLERLIEYQIAGGVAGLFILGTTGEGPSHSYRLRRELIERTCQFTKGRVPILVGITDTSFVESVNLARYSADVGADSVVLAPPFYLPPGQPELVEYIDHLVPELPIPLFLYNMPGLTKVSFEPETVRRAMDHARIIGLKDSSGNMVYMHRMIELLKHRPDWTLLVGPEELLGDCVLAGGHGGVPGGANVFPRLYVDLYEAASRGDLARTRELHATVMQVAGKLYRLGAHTSSYIKGIKTALSLLNICDDGMAEPSQRFEPHDRNRVAVVLKELQTLIG